MLPAPFAFSFGSAAAQRSGGSFDRDAVGGRIVGEAFIHFVRTQAELGQAVAGAGGA